MPTIINRALPEGIKKIIRLFLSGIGRISCYGHNRFAKLEVSVILSNKKSPTFFGYHDKTPFSGDASKILAMSVTASDTRPESEGTAMKLGYFAKNEKGEFEKRFIPFAETTTWCWQQGCMLQWHPSQPNSQVVFNALVDDAYGSVVFDIKQGKVVREYPYPIYSVAPTGTYAATLNFSRLGRLRPGYGYGLLPDSTAKSLVPEDDGLFVFDLQSAERKLVASLPELAKGAGEQGCQHYINHATFSPDGKQIAFFHLWVDSDFNRGMRFFLYNLETQETLLMEGEKKVSHYCWISDEEILATVQADRKAPWEYCTYRTKRVSHANNFGLSLKTDGHPMRSPVVKELFVTDSRANRIREDNVVIFNKINCKKVTVARFFMPVAYRDQVRCDLHPRWDREGRYIVADIVSKGRRAMAVVNIQAALGRLKDNAQD